MCPCYARRWVTSARSSPRLRTWPRWIRYRDSCCHNHWDANLAWPSVVDEGGAVDVVAGRDVLHGHGKVRRDP
eukprot:5947054-Pyramimonas_sp.AAC.1